METHDAHNGHPQRNGEHGRKRIDPATGHSYDEADQIGHTTPAASNQYRKKPVVIQAITFDELIAYGLANTKHVHNGMPWSFDYTTEYFDKDGVKQTLVHPITNENDDCYLIPTAEGTMKMMRGDMLITGVKGEIYPCKGDIFSATYEPVTTPAAGGRHPMSAARYNELRAEARTGGFCTSDAEDAMREIDSLQAEVERLKNRIKEIAVDCFPEYPNVQNADAFDHLWAIHEGHKGVSATCDENISALIVANARVAELEKDKTFPLLDGPRISWSIAAKAYEKYASLYGTGQPLKRIAERGGFGVGEMDEFYPAWRIESDRIAELEKENAQLVTENSEHMRTIHTIRNGAQGMKAELAQKSDRIASLESVVGKLPRTADGKPITFKENYYTDIHLKRNIVGVGILEMHLLEDIGSGESFGVRYRSEDGHEDEVFADLIYSTREAAEAAAKETNNGK